MTMEWIDAPMATSSFEDGVVLTCNPFKIPILVNNCDLAKGDELTMVGEKQEKSGSSLLAKAFNKAQATPVTAGSASTAPAGGGKATSAIVLAGAKHK